MPKYQKPTFGSIGKFKAACHCPLLVKIPEMKRISKPSWIGGAYL